MRTSRIARGSFYAGVATTVAFAASFVHLDAQLSHGSMSALATEGVKTLCLAIVNVVLWSIAFRARVIENRMEAALARKARRAARMHRDRQAEIAEVEQLEAA